MTRTIAAHPDVTAVIAALDAVRDPELDQPVTALKFVSSCTVSDDRVAEVHLRLPTYFCAPNFAFLMVADAYDAVSAVPGITTTVITLDDHFASQQINEGVAARAGFVTSFGADQASSELDELRRDFVRKAVAAGTDRVCRPLLRAGMTPERLANTTLGDLAPSPELTRLRERRSEVGLPADGDAALLVDVVTGTPISPDDVRTYLGKARLTRVNMEANAGVCRGMLASRYGVENVEEEVS